MWWLWMGWDLGLHLHGSTNERLQGTTQTSVGSCCWRISNYYSNLKKKRAIRERNSKTRVSAQLCAFQKNVLMLTGFISYLHVFFHSVQRAHIRFGRLFTGPKPGITAEGSPLAEQTFRDYPWSGPTSLPLACPNCPSPEQSIETHDSW